MFAVETLHLVEAAGGGGGGWEKLERRDRDGGCGIGHALRRAIALADPVATESGFFVLTVSRPRETVPTNLVTVMGQAMAPVSGADSAQCLRVA